MTINLHNIRSLAFAAALSWLAVSLTAGRAADPGDNHDQGGNEIKHVLLLSVDGLHAPDLANYVKAHPDSAFAQLTKHGVTYTQASCSKPSDSFPGLLALVTGGTPAVTGVYYDDSYDRTLLPPLVDADGNSLGGSTPGTEVAYDETIDRDLTRLDAGGGINPARLPRSRATGQPVYPHSFLRVNTIFEAAKAGGLSTAWCDKHPAYDLVNGPSGKGVDDLFTPEINSYTPESATTAHVVNTSSVLGTEHNDEIKVVAILHEIAGFDHTGSGERVGTPAIFGMNFQAVSVGQKLVGNVLPDGAAPSDPNMVNGGYRIDPSSGTPVPSPLLTQALNYVDGSLRRMFSALEAAKLSKSTLIILTAKHGQSPIDPTRVRSGFTGFNLKSAIKNLVNPVAPIAQLTQDDVALIWLQDQRNTHSATKALQMGQANAFIESIYSGTNLQLAFPNPATDSRVPDIIVQPELGVIYSNSTAKDAEHGGFSVDDTNVALVVSSPQLNAKTVKGAVQTTQIAPTILAVLGLDPQALRAVQLQHTQVLPGIETASDQD